jgi:hypothetical protein
LAKKAGSASDLDKLVTLDELQLLEEVARRTGKPLEHILRRGIERASNGGAPTEEMLKEAEAADREATKAELKAIRDELARRDAEAQQQATAAQMQQAVENYKYMALDAYTADAYPHLSAYPEEQIAMAAVRVADYIAGQTDEIPDAAYVLQQLEDNERQQWEAKAAKAGYVRAPRVSPSELASNDDEENNERVAVKRVDGLVPLNPKKQAPPAEIYLEPGVEYRDSNGVIRAGGPTVIRPALTNGAAASRGQSPVDWRNMSERERIERAGKEVFGKRKNAR